ncbi:MAG: deoxyguanosinetriphosphate triphosphohydrolase [Planctomycetes bacterium]|nr:deoxyguanosinetriphosphate triphosphohydrolase [Planctomycetota bacterium]
MSAPQNGIFTREEIEAREERSLAPYGMRSRESHGRRFPEPEHAYRTAFQRDRDRIVHSSAFRRLEYKTQVFVNHEGDHFRTRLTHEMEVAQISRTVARALGLNEDLCEALALIHDLGHTPFGHAGQDAMQELMKDHGGFEHNLQSLRIVETLERRYPDFPGLNLTWEVRESILKHKVKRDQPLPDEYRPDWAPLLEAQVVDLADSIAYDHHDVDDSLPAGFITEEDLAEVELWRIASAEVAKRYPGIDGKTARRQKVRFLIDLAVTDLIRTTAGSLRAQKIASIDDVRTAKSAVAGFSKEMEARKGELQVFLNARVYRHHRVLRMQERAKRFLRDIFHEYVRNPGQLPPEFQSWAREAGTERAVCDYIAGMTDRFAQEEYLKFFQPFERV